MIKTATFLQPLHDCRDKALAGGKAVNLGILLRAAFNVPDGFCVTTDAYRYWADAKSEEIPSDLVDEISRAYRAMGSPSVAVRSSATAEDMSEASMAGQYDTFLDIQDEDALLNRIRCCWASLDSPRTRAYLKEHGIELSQVAMAVVVQRLVPSDVAGVLFTANPQTGSKSEMLVEASWGLGEAVVSGLVQPDVLRIEKQTGRVTHATIADKQVMIPPGVPASVGTSHSETAVPEEKRRIPCVKGPDVAALWKLGLQAADHFGGPQDIEWAIHQSKLYLLQSRPITTLEEAEAYEQLLTSTRAHLRDLSAKSLGPWVVHNISETLPHPTPLTWSVIKRFMSGDGGFGAMYRQAGFEPSPQVCRDGFLTLIAGKPYMDTALAPEMFFEGFPFKYDLNLLRTNPDAAQNPPTIPSGTMSAKAKMARKAGAAAAVVHTLAGDFDQQLNTKLIPEFTAWVKTEKARDLATLTNDQLIDLWHAREKRVMDEFAPQSLLPSLLSGAALAELRAFLDESFWDEDPDQLATLLSSAHPPDRTVQANTALYGLAQTLPPSPASAHNPSSAQSASSLVGEGRGEGLPSGLSTQNSALNAWLSEYGHRAPEEFDLATPRWRERPDDLRTMALRLKDGKNPADLHHAHLAKCDAKLRELKSHLSAADQQELDQKVAFARRYMPFREDGKYYLMLGYDLLRDTALEIGRRLEIGDDVFLLTLEELFDALNIGFAPTHLLAQRKIQRRAEKRIPLPYVIDPTTIDEIGTPPRMNRDGALPVFAISPGAATGPAKIVRSPSEAGDLGDRYILVCPSTDPSWTPLFTNAAGLILECGGTLSHGAVVAREMSIPAVVLRDACTLLHDNDPITVDGRNGTVSRANATPSPASAKPSSPTEPSSPLVGENRGEGSSTTDNGPLTPDKDDLRIDRSLLPPPPGKKERQSAKLRNYFLLIWGLYLAATFLLPENFLYQPSLRFLDFFLWPLVRIFGKPGAVAIIAGGLGALTMIGQRFLTDNHRLLVAKKRAHHLQDLSNALPRESARGDLMWNLAAPVQMRIVFASFVPLAVLLGPLVMIFMWFEPRVAPVSWNAPPGTSVDVVAIVDSKIRDPITLHVPPGLTLDDTTPATQTLPPIRETLEKHRLTLQKPSDLSQLPWEVRESAEHFREEELASLNAYLKEGVPPQFVTWKVRTPEKISGKWPITVSAGPWRSDDINIVTGDAHPPHPAEFSNPKTDPVTNIKINYPQGDQKKVFFAPIGHYDWGWLWVYLLAYLPAMYAFRYLLKIA